MITGVQEATLDLPKFREIVKWVNFAFYTPLLMIVKFDSFFVNNQTLRGTIKVFSVLYNAPWAKDVHLKGPISVYPKISDLQLIFKNVLGYIFCWKYPHSIPFVVSYKI